MGNGISQTTRQETHVYLGKLLVGQFVCVRSVCVCVRKTNLGLEAEVGSGMSEQT